MECQENHRFCDDCYNIIDDWFDKYEMLNQDPKEHPEFKTNHANLYQTSILNNLCGSSIMFNNMYNEKIV